MRKAHVVELHDAGVILHPHDYPDAIAGWNECFCGPQWILGGEHIAHLLEVLGLGPGLGWETKVWSEKDGREKTRVILLRDTEFEVDRRLDVVGSGHCVFGSWIGSHKIGELWAEVVAPRHLRLRFTTLWEHDGEEQSHTVEVEYCGDFTVWWAAAEATIQLDDDVTGEVALPF